MATTGMQFPAKRQNTAQAVHQKIDEDHSGKIKISRERGKGKPSVQNTKKVNRQNTHIFSSLTKAEEQCENKEYSLPEATGA